MNLITSAEFATYTGKPEYAQDTVVTEAIRNVTQRIALHTGRLDFGLSNTLRTEYISGGASMLFLSYWPIVSVSSIIDDIDHVFAAADAEDPTNYHFSTDEIDGGIVQLESGTFIEGFRNVKVQYYAGYASTAAVIQGLKDAALTQLKAEAYKIGAGFQVREESESAALLPEVIAMLRPYKREIFFA